MGQLTESVALIEELRKLRFIQREDYIWQRGGVYATINGRVIAFECHNKELFAAIEWEHFVPRDVMETFQHKQGIQSIETAFRACVKSAKNHEEAQEAYADKVAAHFIACGVPVWHGSVDMEGYSEHHCHFRICQSSNRGHEPIDLFSLKVRFDFGVEFCFEGGHSILVDGDDPVRNIGEVFCADVLDGMLPENPVDRVDYSSSYHYRHIVNAIPDMLRVGVKGAYKETCEIVTALSKPITSCKKHFRPEVIGTITDFCVDFKRSIHPPKKWNE